MKAVFVFGTFELDAARYGKPLTRRTLAMVERLAARHELEIDIVFAYEDSLYAGRNRSEIGIARLRESRARVLSEIGQSRPDFVLLFGPVAAACVSGKGNLSEESLIRRRHEFLGPIPTYYTYSLENLRVYPGLMDWIDLDVQAAIHGWTETEWGAYLVMQPGAITEPQFRSPIIGFDTETYPGLDYYDPNARIRMVQLSEGAETAIVVQLGPDSSMPRWLQDLLENPAVRKVGSNIKYDAKWCRRFGVHVRNYMDTSTREHILDSSNPKTDLKSLTFKYLPRLGDYSRGHRALVKERGGWEHVTDAEQYRYAAADAEASIAAYLGQEEALKRFDRPNRLMEALYPVLAEIEFSGLCIDLDENSRLDTLYRKKLRELSAEIVPVLGPINLNSPTQLADALRAVVPDIDLSPVALRRAMGTEEDEDASTKRLVLERERDKHPIIGKVLDFRKYRTRHSTFIDKVRAKHLSRERFIYPSFRTDLVETYRLSSSEPNVQNIPKKDYDSPELSIKRQFVSRWEGGQVLEVDQSQLEVRFAAWVSGDPGMIEAVKSEDVHRTMAGLLLSKDPAAITEKERDECKARTFLIMYGGGANKLAQDLKIPHDQALGMMTHYFQRFSGLKRYVQSVHDTVRQSNEVWTDFGFRRRFQEPERWNGQDGWSVQRQAFNTMIQNGAACLTYCAMIWMQNALLERKLQSLMVLQVHDSVLFDVAPGELRAVEEIARHGMEIAAVEIARTFGVNFTLPLRADVKVGKNWGEVALLEARSEAQTND